MFRVAIGATVGLLALSGARGQQPALQPCVVVGIAEAARCGTQHVWENREASSGRRIALRVVVLPARRADSLPDPILVLQGGPGQSNVSTAAALAASPLRDRRAMVFIDIRGTGQSNPLECDLRDHSRRVQVDFLPLEQVRACRDSLARKADLSRYTTPYVVDDIAQVLDSLGIRLVNVWGFSGGTRHAQELIRRHPARVRGALLEGPVPMDARIPLTFASDAQEALDGVFADCAAERACREGFPSLEDEFARVLARLRQAPAKVRARDPASGDTISLPVSYSGFAQIMRYLLYQPATTRAIPLAVHRAAQGDFSLVADRVRTLGIPGGVSTGFYLAATCAEDIPWFDEADARRKAAGTFLGDYRVRQQKAACEGWPASTLTRKHLEPVRSDVPVLILVGERDPVTPPRWAREVAATLPNARVLVVPGGGHAFGGLENAECIGSIRAAFIREMQPLRLDVSCLESVRRPPFLTSPAR
jgi:pimeloyl-ACP methyl ester carboxylesterase